MALSSKTIDTARELRDQATQMLSSAQRLAQQSQEAQSPDAKELLEKTAREYAEHARVLTRLGKKVLSKD